MPISLQAVLVYPTGHSSLYVAHNVGASLAQLLKDVPAVAIDHTLTTVVTTADGVSKALDNSALKRALGLPFVGTPTEVDLTDALAGNVL